MIQVQNDSLVQDSLVQNLGMQALEVASQPGFMDQLALFGTGIIVLSLLLSVLSLVLVILFLLRQQKTLQMAGGYATLSPGLVWLSLVPLVNIVWPLIVALKTSESVVAAGAARGIDVGDGAKTMGILFGASNLLSILILPAFLVPIFWVIYWLKLKDLCAKLA